MADFTPPSSTSYRERVKHWPREFAADVTVSGCDELLMEVFTGALISSDRTRRARRRHRATATGA
jgi:hypothetical protein